MRHCVQDIAFTMARRFGLPGADELFQRQFNQLFASGDYKGVTLSHGSWAFGSYSLIVCIIDCVDRCR